MKYVKGVDEDWEKWDFIIGYEMVEEQYEGMHKNGLILIVWSWLQSYAHFIKKHQKFFNP